MRKTVIFTTPDSPEPRDFHLDPVKAERFAEQIRREGGTAEVKEFTPSSELLAMLSKCGVTVR